MPIPEQGAIHRANDRRGRIRYRSQVVAKPAQEVAAHLVVAPVPRDHGDAGFSVLAVVEPDPVGEENRSRKVEFREKALVLVHLAGAREMLLKAAEASHEVEPQQHVGGTVRRTCASRQVTLSHISLICYINSDLDVIILHAGSPKCSVFGGSYGGLMPREVFNKLSAVKVRRIKAPGRYADGCGLYLVVSESGARWWQWRGMVQGRRRKIGLGSERLVSLRAGERNRSRLAPDRA